MLVSHIHQDSGLICKNFMMSYSDILGSANKEE